LAYKGVYTFILLSQVEFCYQSLHIEAGDNTSRFPVIGN